MRTLVAVPCMDMMHTQFVSSLVGLKLADDYEVRFGASSLIYDTRNQLLVYALENGFDRVLWLDSDMVFTPDVLACLEQDAEKGFDVVSGLYFKRKPPHSPVVFRRCEVVKTEDGKVNPVDEVFSDYPDECLFEIAACGFGCVLMNMESVRRVAETYGRWLFMPLGGFGEDLSFCLRARAAGLRIWCDSRAKCGHVGEMIFDEDYYKRLQE